MINSDIITITEDQGKELCKILEQFEGHPNDNYTRSKIKYTVIKFINSVYSSNYIVDCEITGDCNHLDIQPFETNTLKSDIQPIFLERK